MLLNEDSYCVRPNSGRIESGSEVEVQGVLRVQRQASPSLDRGC